MKELQMAPPGAERRRGTPSRTVLWLFEKLSTLRRNLIARVGRLTRPGGKLTLTLSPNRAVKVALDRFLLSA
jgi:hypothetical protein